MNLPFKMQITFRGLAVASWKGFSAITYFYEPVHHNFHANVILVGCQIMEICYSLDFERTCFYNSFAGGNDIAYFFLWFLNSFWEQVEELLDVLHESTIVYMIVSGSILCMSSSIASLLSLMLIELRFSEKLLLWLLSYQNRYVNIQCQELCPHRKFGLSYSNYTCFVTSMR